MIKKKVVVVGNCQARPIGALLEKMSDEIEVTKIAIVHLLKSDQQEDYRSSFEEADFIVAQLVSDDYACSFVRTIELEKKFSSKLIKIVNLFSYKDTPYLRNLPKNLRISQAPFGDYHFPVVYEKWKAGINELEVIEQLNNWDTEYDDDHGYLDQLKQRELQVSVAISDFIEGNTERLFHTFNHPCNNLLLEYTKRILRTMSLPISNSDPLIKGEFLGQYRPFFNENKNFNHRLMRESKVITIETEEMIRIFYDFYAKYDLDTRKSAFDIPKNVIQYWNSESIPREIRKLMDSWRVNNPDYSYHTFDRGQAATFLASEFGSEYRDRFLAMTIPAMQSDYFRVAYILKHGGIYIDAASECFSDITPILKDSIGKTVLMKKWHGRLCNGFIASASGSLFMKNIWDRINKKIDDNNEIDVWSITGPKSYIEAFNSELKKLVKVVDQSDVKKYFVWVNDLEHKKNNHWSVVQKNNAIYSNGNSSKIIVHLGPHKTATTSFQNLLESNESKLIESDISLITVRSTHGYKYKELRSVYTRIIQGYLLSDEKNEIDSISQLSKVLKDMVSIIPEDKNGYVIISDENLLGPLPGHFFANRKGRELGFYRAHDLVFKSINVAFGNRLAKVLLADRGCEEFLSSSYKDFIGKLTDSESFDQFKSNLDESICAEYSSFFKLAEVNFGEKLDVFSFSDFCQDMEGFINKVLDANLDFEDSVTSLSNTSMSDRAISIALKVIPDLNDLEEAKRFKRFLLSII